MKGHMESDGFHPHTTYKGVRKSRDQTVKTEGIRKSRNRFHPKGYKPPTFGKKKPAGTWEITKTSYNPHIHKFDQLDYDSGDNTERGHCELCGKWVDTSTGVVEKVEGDDDFVRKARDQKEKTEGIRLKRNQVKNKYGTFTWNPRSLRVNQVVKIKDLTGRHGNETGTSRVAITEATSEDNFKDVANNPPIINGKVIGVVRKGQILNKKFEVVSV